MVFASLMRRPLVPGLAAAVIALMFVVPAAPSRADQDASQYVGVARISALDGSVEVRQDGGSAVAAAINAPLTAGEYVITGAQSRVEVQIDDANFIRASESVQMRFTQMDPSQHTLQLAAGTIELSILRVTDGRPQVQTPSVAILPADVGIYRVTVTSDGRTLLTVRSGKAELLSSQGGQQIEEGKSVAISGSPSSPNVRPIQTIAYDDFDAWNTERDKIAYSAYAGGGYVSSGFAGSGYTNTDMAGVGQLQNYGTWGYTSSFGFVWTPYHQSGWSPYSFGRWSYAQPIGWTWIGYEPWGWAPYHYGRWFYRPAFGWAWWPGSLYSPFYWQPGLVAFFDFSGGGFGVGCAYGCLGWVPLAPYEPFYPFSRVATFSPIQHVNVGSVYNNSTAPGGINVIRNNNLTDGGKYQYVHVAPHDLQDVTLARGGPGVAPTAAGMRYTQNPVGIRPIALSPRFSTMPIHVAPMIPLNGSNASNAINAANGAAQNPWSRLENAQPGSTKPNTAGGAHTNSLMGPTTTTSDPWSRFNSWGFSIINSAHGPTFSTKMPNMSTFPNAPGLRPFPMQGGAFNFGQMPRMNAAPMPQMPAMPAMPPPAPAPHSGGNGH